MRDVSSAIRLDARRRVDALLSFNTRLRKEPVSINHLKEWNLQLDDKLVEIPGRELDSQNIVFGQMYGKIFFFY